MLINVLEIFFFIFLLLFINDDSTIKMEIKHFKGIPKKRVLCYLGAAIVLSNKIQIKKYI